MFLLNIAATTDACVSPSNIILVVSKWDISGRSDVSNEEELENFVQERLPMTNNLINSYELFKWIIFYYSINLLN